jgi:hypothetical protein
MKVSYTIDALTHLAKIHNYIEERNPLAATRVPRVFGRPRNGWVNILTWVGRGPRQGPANGP